MNRLNTLSLIILFAAFSNKALSQKQSSFRLALNKHLNAISTKNLTDISATVDDSIILIFPDGEVLKSKNKFVEMHQNWFKDSLWKMTTEVLNTIEDKSLAYANVKYKYSKFKPDGTALSVSNTYLLLIFKKEKNSWKVIHDQNTKITIQ
jgi:ketosteroid isomerase-like protein